MSHFQRAAHRFGPIVAILMIGAVVLGGLHHHGTPDDHHPCALCTVAHSPAVASGGISAPSVAPAIARPFVLPPLAARARVAASAVSPRAPPLA